MTRHVPLRRVATLKYGEALPEGSRIEGGVPVISSGGVIGRHDTANTSGPVIAIGRKGSFGSVWWSEEAAFVIDTAFYVDGASACCDLRWLFYVLSTLGLTKVTSDVGVPGLSREDVHKAGIPRIPLEEQRRVAEFLDDKLRLLDSMAITRKRQIKLQESVGGFLLAESLSRLGCATAASVDFGWKQVDIPVGWRVARLGVVLRQLTNGYVGPTRDILKDDGIRYVQGTHIKRGRIEFDRRPFFVATDWYQERPRIHLREGDVLIVQTGDIGQVALVPPDFGPAACHALLIARTHAHLVSPRYLAEYLRSGFGQAALRSRATGALHPHLEGGIRSTPVLLPPLAEQERISGLVAARRAESDQAAQQMRRSVALLDEYKRSLIAAAVTGQIDVTASGSNIPG